MTVKAILEEKGREVVTIEPGQTLAQAAQLLADRRIGAVVVTGGDGRVAGILSERDIVRAVGTEGAEALMKPVSSAMTREVRICLETHTVNDVMEFMTRGRFRHLPVEKEGRLDGIVSIGDVVKRRIHEVEQEAEEIKQYIATA